MINSVSVTINDNARIAAGCIAWLLGRSYNTAAESASEAVRARKVISIDPRRHSLQTLEEEGC